MREAVLYGASYALGLFGSFVLGFIYGRKDQVNFYEIQKQKISGLTPPESSRPTLGIVKPFPRHEKHKPVTLSEEALWAREKSESANNERPM